MKAREPGAIADVELSHEEQCKRRADHFEKELDILDQPSDNSLPTLVQRFQARALIEDYRVKFRQSDHVKALLYGPLSLSLASFALAFVLAVSSGIQTVQTWQRDASLGRERHDVDAALVLKILEARSAADGQRLLAFLEDAKLIKLSAAQRDQLKSLLR